MPQRQLEGEVVPERAPDDRDLIIRGLRTQLAEAEDSSRVARMKVAQIEGGLRQLRSFLAPLHSWMKDIFGELNAMGIAEGMPAPGTPVALNSKWDVIKSHHPGRIAEAIDILLAHGRMNTAQLAVAMKTSHGNCKDNIVKRLAALGLIVREGREFRLKDF
jgi:hypothetical protein